MHTAYSDSEYPGTRVHVYFLINFETVRLIVPLIRVISPESAGLPLSLPAGPGLRVTGIQGRIQVTHPGYKTRY